MTPHSTHSRTPQRGTGRPCSGRIPALRSSGRGGMGLALILLASSTLAVFGMSVLGRRNDLVGRSPKPAAPDPQARLLEIREQSALDSKEPYWPYRLAQVYLAVDSTSNAETALKASLERDRFYAPALSLLSKLYFDAGRHQEAVDLLESARSQPDSFPEGVPPALLAGLALHYDALDRVDLARSVMAAAPRSESGSDRSARIYVTLRGTSPDSATDLATAAWGDDSTSAVNQNNFGITRLRAGDPTSARGAFMKAIELDPKLPGPYYNLAILEKYYVFDDEAAARWLDSYRARSRQDPDSLFKVFKTSSSSARKEN